MASQTAQNKFLCKINLDYTYRNIKTVTQQFADKLACFTLEQTRKRISCSRSESFSWEFLVGMCALFSKS